MPIPVENIIALQVRGIHCKRAADLRARLATFSEDWDSPEMEAYDNYDTLKSAVLRADLEGLPL